MKGFRAETRSTARKKDCSRSMQVLHAWSAAAGGIFETSSYGNRDVRLMWLPGQNFPEKFFLRIIRYRTASYRLQLIYKWPVYPL